MSNKRTIDMSKLPPPQVVKPVDFEVILAEMKADIKAEVPEVAAALELESSTIVKFLERSAYWLMGNTQAANEDALAVMLPYAKGADLDNLGAIYDVERLVIITEDASTTPPTPAVMEGDEALRRRIQLAPKSFSTAGPIDAYVFHALGADGRVKDVEVTSPEPGEVVVTILSHEDKGEASSELLAIVDRALNDKDVRPLTDWVTLESTEVIAYEVEATVYTLSGPDTSVVMETVEKSIKEYVETQRGIGIDVPLSGLYSALHLSGVDRIVLTSPATDIAIGSGQSAYCGSIKLVQNDVYNREGLHE